MPSTAPTTTSGPQVSKNSGDETATNSKSHELCDPPETENVETFQPSAVNPTMLVPSGHKIVPLANSSVHKIVGDNGVLMLSMTRFSERSTYASSQLIRIGIYPTLLPATDSHCASKAALEKGCVSRGGGTSIGACRGKGGSFLEQAMDSRRTGIGCVNANIQAVADSHRRALEVAMKRQEEWTAIFEDDAIPVFDDDVDWNSEFQKAWATKPATATVVRLSWCSPPGKHAVPVKRTTNQTVGLFQWVRTDGAAGCTAAYMVHKSAVPAMLKVFPCCCAVDCCYAWDVYAKQTVDLVNLAAVGGEEWIEKNEIADWGEHDGIIMQAKSKHGTKSANTGSFLSIQRGRPLIHGFSSKYSLQRDAHTGSMALVAK
jgi:hypothetical protein